jgi:hypothetical protein
MKEPIFKYHLAKPDNNFKRGSWSRYYSCWFVCDKKPRYLGCIFKDVGDNLNSKPYYVMRGEPLGNPYIHYRTREECAAHLLFENL